MAWPPMSRTVSGRLAERSVSWARCWCCFAVLGEMFGEGDTCGNADPRLPLLYGFDEPGKGLPPLPGRPLFGRKPPSPAPLFVGVGVGEEPSFDATVILSEAVAVLIACFEVADTVTVMWRPASAWNALSLACDWTACPALRPDTSHVDLPVAWQTVKVGLTPFRAEPTVIFAVPPLPLVSQTQMATCTVVPGCTVLLPPRVCTLRQSVAEGGGVVVLVGVGVAVDVGVGVAVGLLFVPPGAIVGLLAGALAGMFPVEPGFELPGLELGVTAPPPGEGSGTGGVPAGVDGCGPVLGTGGDVEVAAAEPAVAAAAP